MNRLLLTYIFSLLWSVTFGQPTPQDLRLVIKMNDTLIAFPITRTETGLSILVDKIKDTSNALSVSCYEKTFKGKYIKSKSLSKDSGQNYLNLHRQLTGKYKLILTCNKETMTIEIEVPNFKRCKLEVEFIEGEFEIKLKELPKNRDDEGNIDITPYISKK